MKEQLCVDHVNRVQESDRRSAVDQRSVVLLRKSRSGEGERMKACKEPVRVVFIFAQAFNCFAGKSEREC